MIIINLSIREGLRDRRSLKKPLRFRQEVNLSVLNEPVTYKEAMSGINSDKWKQAVEELNSHKKMVRGK